jgi:CMP-2-keto-3-deoxyoctulosonic acid synthetase
MRENIDNNKVVFLRENELDDGQENKTINIMQKLASKLNFIDVKLYDKENEKFTQLNMNPNHCKLYRNIDEKALAFSKITIIYIDVNTGDSFLIHDYAFRHIFAYMCLLKIKELNHIIEYNRLFIEYNNAFKIQSEIKTAIDNYKLKIKDSENKNTSEPPEYSE